MQHVTKRALLGSVAIVRKGDEDDPVSIVTKSLEDLQKALDERLKKVEGGTEIKALTDRIADLEKKANRPGSGKADVDEQKEIERKALASMLRTGNASPLHEAGAQFEAKAASSDSDPAGGYFVLPTVDLAIRNLMVDISPMRGLAEVVTISSDRYERFYSMGRRGAQKVSERDDRPQDTARPDLIKHSYGVVEYYAAPVATAHLLSDAATDIASWLINNATQDFEISEGEDFLNGDGNDGAPQGLLTYGTAAEKDFDRPWKKHQHVAAGADAPTDDQLAKALVAMTLTLRKPYRKNARWVFNSTTAIRVRQLQDTTKRFLWAPTGNLLEGNSDLLLGYPVEIDENMPDIGAGKLPIAFGDFRQGYVVVDRQGVRIKIDEVTQKGRTVFDVYKRTGGGAGDFNAIKFLKAAAA